ncbi:putative transcription factor B3-Domain family [Helianthus anomalus]
MAIPSDASYRLWGKDKAPTNVLLHIDNGRSYSVLVNSAKGILFLFHGWSEVVVQLGLKKGSLLVFNPLDATTFKTWLTSALCRFSVIPEFILPKLYTYTSTDFNVASFSKGIDVVVHQFHLEARCYMVFTKLFGNFFRLTIFSKNCVELNFTGVDVQKASLHFFCFFI